MPLYREKLERIAGQKVAQNPNYINRAYTIASERFENTTKKELLDEFDNHPITQEIKAGPEASSQYLSEGNLYGFIGFSEENPTKPIRDLLEETRVKRLGATARYNKTSITYTFPVDAPSIEEIENVTPTPFGTGKSWVRMLERGVNSLGYYIKRFLSKRGATDPSKQKYIEEKSRSGAGIQLKNERKNPETISGRFSYMTDILKRLKSKLR